MNIKGKPFTDVLGELAHGQFLQDLTEATYNVVAAVMETRKLGRIKIALEIAPTGKGTVVVNATFDTKEPEHDRETTTFFVGKDFSLQRSDPNQPRLPLHAVEKPINPPIKVAE